MCNDKHDQNNENNSNKNEDQRKRRIPHVLSFGLLLLVIIIPIFYISTDGFKNFPLGQQAEESLDLASQTSEEKPVEESVTSPAYNQPASSEELSTSQDVSLSESSSEESALSESLDESLPSESIAEDSTSSESVAESSAEEAVQNPGTSYAQGSANTAPTVQNRQATGANHNEAAGIYAYSVPEVKEAMFDGQALDGDKKIAFLTFDDGISAHTGELLDILNQEGVPSTFFILGSTLTESNRESLERMYNEGHALALHSYNHIYENLYPGRSGNVDEVIYQYDLSLSALQAILGDSISTAVWRYPGGHMSWYNLGPSDDALYARGVNWIDWNAFNGDASGNPPQTVQEQVDTVFDGWNAYGQPSAIVVLMHDTTEKELTRQALPAIIQSLREEGFSFGILE